MIRFLLTRLTLLAVILLGHSSAAQADPPIIIRFSHVVKADTPKGKAARKFADLAKERTNGRVIVQVYDNASLYKDKDEMEAVQLGSVEMLAPSLAKFGQLGLHDFEVFDLPYIFRNREGLQTITQGPIGAQLLRQLEERGIKGLAYWDNGFKVFSANTPIRLPSDLKGKRMRVQPSKVIETQMTTLGSEALPLSYSDAYRALKTGLADGTENPPSNLYSEKMHEVQPYVTVTNHGYLGYAVIVNKRFWESLPRDIRETLEKCIQEATKENNDESERLNEQALVNIQNASASSVIYPTPEELQEWRKALEPVYEKMQGRINKDLINNIRRANQPANYNASNNILSKPKKN
jgi:C4-dicarboxylate-binding protein DctP